ncbi:GtrA family protein [Pseudoxanthomonas gei]|uniref:GtrA family protein n=1 Tax=Pseudoxanthomonas gei TaxID=1383030 RepID=UPI0031B607E0
MEGKPLKLLAHRESRFVAVGLFQLVLDWTLFVILTACGVPTIWSNTLGRTCIAVLGFALHGRYTFGEAGQSRLGWQRFARFAASWLSLTACSTVAMQAIREQWGLSAAWIAKPGVELVLAIVSYLVLRRWVYR